MRRTLMGICMAGWPSLAWAGAVINEILPDPTGSDGGHEWVEIANNDPSGSIDLSGYTLEVAVSGANYSVKYTFPNGTLLAAGDFLVVGDPGFVGADLSASSNLGFGNASNNADGVRLRSGGTTIDTLVYGTPNSENIVDDSGVAAVSLAPAPNSGESLAREPDGHDTNSGSDFVILSLPTPNATNGTPTVCESTGPVKINELMPNPEGTDTDHEWVELYNASLSDVNLNGWHLEWGNSSFSSSFQLSALVVPPGGFVVLGGSAVPGTDITIPSFAMGNASSSADGLRIVDCNDLVRDTVIYGSPNTDNWLDDNSVTAVSMAPTPADGLALARQVDGVDSNASGADFAAVEVSTPGQTNTASEPTCDSGPVVINEFLPDPDGTDDHQEWIELYNSSADSLDLSGWQIQSATAATYETVVTLPSELTLEAHGYLVVGGSGVPGADLGFDNFSLPNGTHGDGVRLTDCHGEPEDTVVFGKDNQDAVIDDLGSVSDSLASDPGEGQSLARRINGVDTNASDVDFLVSDAPSPGEANPEEAIDPCEPNQGMVTINEVLYDPSSDDAGSEWLELYNAADVSLSLAGWVIQTGDNEIELPSGTHIPANGYLVIGGDQVLEADLVRDLDLPNTTDPIDLTDCNASEVDHLEYGEGLDGTASEGSSLARVEDGVDSNTSQDWFADHSPTPGNTNVESAPPGGDSAEQADPPGGCGGNSAPGGCNQALAPWWIGAAALILRRKKA